MDYSYILLGVILFLIILLIYIISLIRNSINKKDKESDYYKNIEIESFGRKGEITVSKMLNKITSKYGGKVFDNFTFKDNDGYSSNIDHILVCKGGIFIIETKANKGEIYGKDNCDTWVALKEVGKTDKQFFNPVKQNNGHIRHLKRVFRSTFKTSNNIKMISMVIFPYADNLNHIDSKYVYDLDDAYEFIASKIINNNYSSNYVEKLISQLNRINSIYGISMNEHLKICKKKNR